jgi:hypothetical protein
MYYIEELNEIIVYNTQYRHYLFSPFSDHKMNLVQSCTASIIEPKHSSNVASVAKSIFILEDRFILSFSMAAFSL